MENVAQEKLPLDEPESPEDTTRRERIWALRQQGMTWEDLQALIVEETGEIAETEALINSLHTREFFGATNP